MRIAVVSDTHGNTVNFLKTVENMGKFDLLIHLGDYVRDGEKIAEILSLPSLIVKGNGDYSSKFKENEIIEINGKRLFITHGHKFDVRWDYSNLYYKGMEERADLVLYGHTHIPLIVKENNLIIMNPGSPALPRALDGKKTFGIIEISNTVIADIIPINL